MARPDDRLHLGVSTATDAGNPRDRRRVCPRATRDPLADLHWPERGGDADLVCGRPMAFPPCCWNVSGIGAIPGEPGFPRRGVARFSRSLPASLGAVAAPRGRRCRATREHETQSRMASARRNSIRSPRPGGEIHRGFLRTAPGSTIPAHNLNHRTLESRHSQQRPVLTRTFPGARGLRGCAGWLEYRSGRTPAIDDSEPVGWALKPAI